MIPEWVAIVVAIGLFVAPAFILVVPRKDRGCRQPFDWQSEADL